MKSLRFFTLIATSMLMMQCSPAEDKTKDAPAKEDSTNTTENEMPVIEEIEMSFTYEVTYKSGKVVRMSQEEYLKSGVWEDPDVVIKEIPDAMD